MFFNGNTLVCRQDFFIFKKGQKYYCSHVAEGHFFIYNKGSCYNVAYIKIPFSLATKFMIVY